MTKNDIAVALCHRNFDLPKSTALEIVDNIVDIISGAFLSGDNVYLRGFGTLELITAKEKKARNISTGTPVLIPAHKTVKFRISKQLKHRINNGTMD